jgi:hypothetical protein
LQPHTQRTTPQPIEKALSSFKTTFSTASTCEIARELSSVVEVDFIPLNHLGKARYHSLNRAYPIGDLTLIPDGALDRAKQLVEYYGLECHIGG